MPRTCCSCPRTLHPNDTAAHCGWCRWPDEGDPADEAAHHEAAWVAEQLAIQAELDAEA